MPFDGTECRVSQALEKLDQVIALLATPDRWCKGTEETPDGRRCIIGALRACGAQPLLQPVILSAIAEVTGCHRTVQDFNDKLSTSHALMLAVLHRAREGIVAGRFDVTLPSRGPGGRWQTLLGLRKREPA
jgi:hypothetical protein